MSQKDCRQAVSAEVQRIWHARCLLPPLYLPDSEADDVRPDAIRGK